MLQLPMQKIRSSINGHSAKCVNFQRAAMCFPSYQKMESCYHENMLFCADDYPEDDLKTRVLDFLISEWRDSVKSETSDFS